MYSCDAMPTRRPPPPLAPRPTPPRCHWATNDLSIAYHDQEWGVPVHDDRLFFEFLILEGMQAGLSWDTILRKRPAFREAFDNFDPAAVARYDARKRSSLMKNEGIIRNRMKIDAAVHNARTFLKIQDEHGSFDAFIWRFVGEGDGTPRVNRWKTHKQVPASTPESEAMSKDLRRRGCNFVGPTICYAFMQATGMVNDHLVSCFRYGVNAR